MLRDYKSAFANIAGIILQIAILVPLFFLPLTWWQFLLLVIGIELVCTVLWFLEPLVGIGILVWSCIYVVNNVTGFWKVFYFIFFAIDCVLILALIIGLLSALIRRD